ncbi:hypothetical protein D3C71_1836010 [compost metagenome]
MLFVQRLRNIQGFLRGVPVFGIGFTLQKCKIVQLIREFLGFFYFIAGDNPGFAAYFFGNCCSPLTVGQAIPLPSTCIRSLGLLEYCLNIVVGQ